MVQGAGDSELLIFSVILDFIMVIHFGYSLFGETVEFPSAFEDVSSVRVYQALFQIYQGMWEYCPQR
ncbi:hypothetical protein GCM10010912_56340 [Paenibacillus albidus]|uniref:Uncharacterized protein n=1 Tax=Paenibacillus albidus TaxID=2041023 RepID=A0A917FV78_9BACL|nr:hypothetical protein GCM10010912_56340 [Paenibacillus albidus]